MKFDVDYVLSRNPRYVLLFFHEGSPSHEHGVRLLADPRFEERYRLRRDFRVSRLYTRREES